MWVANKIDIDHILIFTGENKTKWNYQQIQTQNEPKNNKEKEEGVLWKQSWKCSDSKNKEFKLKVHAFHHWTKKRKSI